MEITCAFTTQARWEGLVLRGVRKVNSLAKTHTSPLAQVDDSVGMIGAASCISKLDLVKGYWLVLFNGKAKQLIDIVVSGCLPVSGHTVRPQEHPNQPPATNGQSNRGIEPLYSLY